MTRGHHGVDRGLALPERATGGLRERHDLHLAAVVRGELEDRLLEVMTRDATARAEKACLISNAIRGNVPVLVEPDITVG